jgi:hypothetical protein
MRRTILFMALKKFRFEAISKAGKTVTGFLFSENAEAARAKLKSEGNAVLSLDLFVAQEKENSDLQDFEFKATTTDGRTIHGEIEAQTQYVAYRKLRIEYDFHLEYLILKNLPFEQKEALKKQRMNPQLELLFEQDEEGQEKKVKTKKDKIEVMLEERQDEMLFLQAQTGVITNTVKKLLGEHTTYMDAERKRHIQTDLDRLSRLRQSSSINHLEQIMKRLFKQLTHEDLFIITNDEDNLLEVEKSRVEIKKVVKQLSTDLKKGLSAVQIGDLEKFAKLLHMGSCRRCIVTLYWGFVFLLVMLLNFWVLTFGRMAFNRYTEKMYFYLTSAPLWFLTGFSAIIVIFFAFAAFPLKKPLSLTKQLVLYGVAVAAMAIFTLQFPVFFFWTN